MSPLDLSAAALRVEPFPCFTVTQVVSEELEQKLLAWFEAEAPWRLAVMDFYEQYEFDFKDAVLPESLGPLFSDATLNQLRDEVGSVLRSSLRSISPHTSSIEAEN